MVCSEGDAPSVILIQQARKPVWPRRLVVMTQLPQNRAQARLGWERVPADRSKLVRLGARWPTYMGDKYSSVVGPAVGRAGQGALMYGWGRANHRQ